MDWNDYCRVLSNAGENDKDDSILDETREAILRQERMRKLRKDLKLHRKKLNSYMTRFKNGEKVSRIADSIGFSPFMLLRLLLEYEFQCNAKKVSEMIKNSNSVNERWQFEIQDCIRVDMDCAPIVDKFRHSIGIKYEYKLFMMLQNHEIAFETEEQLRVRGLSKTPDACISVPFGYYAEDKTFRIVNWIDSKAMFGDQPTHSIDNMAQLEGYVNRFGPGLVIYWFGYLQCLDVHPDIGILDRFPQNIVHMKDCLDG